MNFTEILRIVLINLFENKFKVILTSLGIIVATTTIVMVIAIGRGGEEEVKKQFSELSAETIYVNPNYVNNYLDLDRQNFPKLSITNMEQILDESTTISNIYLNGSVNKEINLNGQKENLQIIGVTDQYAEVSNLKILQGEHIKEEDLEESKNIVVIGNGVCKKYFEKEEDAIGSVIKIDNKSFKIVGVLKRKGDGIQGINPDDSIYAPFTTASEKLFDEYTTPQIVALVSDLKLINKAMNEIKDTLNFMLEDEDIYITENAGNRIEAATKSAKTMNLLLISVATIVFIVGGIGIMNVLFVSVKERTREIGILKALGSSRKDIMLQFLLEGIIISTFGGVVGVCISYILMPIMKFTQIPVVPSITGQIMAIMFSVLTGTVFGFYPAYKASKLKPIEALNHE